MLHALAKTLQSDRVEVKTVDNGSDAIEAIRRCFYSLCFLDLCLPDMHGIDAIMKIKSLSPDTKILAMSASNVDYYYRELIDKFAHMFIPKPFELAYVNALAQQLMEKNGGIKPACERRRIPRIMYSKAITFRINSLDENKMLERDAHIVDISKIGMGINTNYPVILGCILRFDVFKDGSSYTAGIVKNSVLLNNYQYRAGIEFV